ncbi:MAG: Uncharacterized protein G01um101430_476 [Parcubacteria group bacterium Gr01-1014_30]|nr:MAG: Uncharacterized protein G01um101430_476 [Parcubacteria group bacterium Gr01-1014_30]
MPELNKKKYGYFKRIAFPEGEQSKFLKDAQTRLNLRLKEFAKLAGVHMRSLTDWRREKVLMSLPALERICRRAKIPFPENIQIKEPFWYVNKGAKKGWMAVVRKYGRIGGDPEYRKKRWYEWWENEGRYRKNLVIGITKPIKRPILSTRLAELIGILLGDGGITKSQVTVTLNKYDDKEYSEYVEALFVKLFRVTPSVYYGKKNDSTIAVVISRTELVRFLVENGLKIGGKVKQQVDVPVWIKQTEKFIKDCLRGLFDTDGCFYVDKHYHRNKDKIYLNCGMNFTNRSLPILSFFKNSLERLGLHPTQKTEFSVFLRKENEIMRYFQEIGSSNPKHFNKFKAYFTNKYGEVPKWSKRDRLESD